MRVRPFLLLPTFIVGMFAPALASANEITLTLKQRDVAISGTFAGFTDEAYVIETAEGTILYVPARHVDCKGTDCLVIVASNATAE